MPFTNRSVLLCVLAHLISIPTTSFAKTGSAILDIMPDNNNIQSSNFGGKSFMVKNTGGKDIVKFEIDVTNALFPDSVFDPEGLAGDTAYKLVRTESRWDSFWNGSEMETQRFGDCFWQMPRRRF